MKIQFFDCILIVHNETSISVSVCDDLFDDCFTLNEWIRISVEKWIFRMSCEQKTICPNNDSSWFIRLWLFLYYSLILSHSLSYPSRKQWKNRSFNHTITHKRFVSYTHTYTHIHTLRYKLDDEFYDIDTIYLSAEMYGWCARGLQK
jgi:hypothetical protein